MDVAFGCDGRLCVSLVAVSSHRSKICSYQGVIMTVQEHNELDIICNTGVAIPDIAKSYLSRKQRRKKNETDATPYSLVANADTIGANINDLRNTERVHNCDLVINLELIDPSRRRLPHNLVEFVAIRDIEAGEVLSTKYGEEFWNCNEMACDKCHGYLPEYGNDIIVCERCEIQYHMKCIQLEEIAAGQWFCQECSALQALSSPLLTSKNAISSSSSDSPMSSHSNWVWGRNYVDSPARKKHREDAVSAAADAPPIDVTKFGPTHINLVECCMLANEHAWSIADITDRFHTRSFLASTKEHQFHRLLRADNMLQREPYEFDEQQFLEVIGKDELVGSVWANYPVEFTSKLQVNQTPKKANLFGVSSAKRLAKRQLYKYMTRYDNQGYDYLSSDFTYQHSILTSLGEDPQYSKVVKGKKSIDGHEINAFYSSGYMTSQMHLDEIDGITYCRSGCKLFLLVHYLDAYQQQIFDGNSVNINDLLNCQSFAWTVLYPKQALYIPASSLHLCVHLNEPTDYIGLWLSPLVNLGRSILMLKNSKFMFISKLSASMKLLIAMRRARVYKTSSPLPRREMWQCSKCSSLVSTIIANTDKNYCAILMCGIKITKQVLRHSRRFY